MRRKHIEKFHHFRKTIVVIATVISVGFYYIGTEFLAPSRNVISTFVSPLFKTDYKFYSGNIAGNYYYIGSKIDSSSKIADSNYSVANIQSDGATENLLRISSSPRSMGFIQEDTLESSLFDKKFVEENINKIAYFYTEKLHILYWPIPYVIDKDKKGIDSSIKGSLVLRHKNGTNGLDKKISRDQGEVDALSNEEALHYLSNIKVKMNLGTPSSGSRLIAHAILNSAGVEGFEEREENFAFAKAMEKFLKRDIHVVFYFTGTPLDKIQNALDHGAKLMTIKAVNLIKTLKQDYSILTRPAKFGSEYKYAQNIGTIGSRATLIASNDVSNKALVEILSNFVTYIDTLEDINGQPADEGRVLPIKRSDLINALDVVKAKYSKDKDELLRNVLLFIMSLVTGTFIVLKLVNDFVSHLKKHRYFDKIQEISLLTHSIGGESNDCHPPIKSLHEQQIRLQDLMMEISADYRTGGITDSSIRFLEERINSSIERLRRNVKKLLIQSKSGGMSEYTNTEELIAELLSHGFIDSELADKWINKPEITPVI